MAMGGVALLLSGALFVWLVLPSIVLTQIEKRGSELLQREVSVERVALDPLTLAITIEGLSVQGRDGEELMGWRRLYANGKFWATVTGGLGADAVELEGLRVRLHMDESGELNVADLLAKWSGEKSSETRPFEVDDLHVVEAQITLVDDSRSRPFSTRMGPLTFSVADFHTKFDPQAPYQFEVSTEVGESLRWRGTLSAAPLRSTGEFEVSGLNIPKYAAYYADLLPFELGDGVVHASGRYTLAWSDEEQVLQLAEGETVISDLVIEEKDDPLIRQSVAEIRISEIEADWSSKSLTVAQVNLTDGAVEMHRTARGIEWIGLLLWGVRKGGTGAFQDAMILDEIRVDRVTAERIAYVLRDHALTEPTELNFDLRKAEIRGAVFTDLTQPVQLTARGVFPRGGMVSAGGSLAFNPLQPDLKIEVNDLNLLMGADYLRQMTGTELTDGRLAIVGQISGDNGELGLDADMTLSALQLNDADGTPLVGAQSLILSGVDFRLDPIAVGVENVNVLEPKVAVRRDAEGNLNVLRLLDHVRPSVDSPEIAVDVTPVEKARPILEVGKIAVENGAFVWTDKSALAPVTMELNGVSGVMQGWSPEDVARAQVEIAGRINAEAPFTMTGDLNPLGRPAHANLTIKVDRMDLRPTDGYVQQYAGFVLDDGEMSLDIDFQLQDRAIESETLTVLDGFSLGEKVESADATNLPVKLGVALLTDPEGEIVVDVPARGHLDDPEFRLGRVIWRVITNLLSKAATSPFALLGNAVGADAEMDLENHTFVPGTTDLTTKSAETLSLVLAALQERPELSLGIRGEYDAAADGAVLRPLVLEKQLRTRTAADRFSADGNWLPLAREEALVARYEEVFGEPPFDPQGSVPVRPVIEDIAAAAPNAPTETELAEPARSNFLVWLRRVLTGPPQSAAEEATAGVAEPESSLGSFPLPEDIEPELPALAPAEINRRLLERIEVSDTDLRALADQRAIDTQAYLQAAGLAIDRMTVLESSAGGAQVTLDLR